MEQERTAADILWPEQSAKAAPEAKPESGGERTAGEILYGKEPPKEQPADSQKSEGQDSKDWFEKGAEDAAKANRYELRLPDGALVDEPLMSDFTKLGREHGFTTEQAQRFADLHLKATEEVGRQVAEYREIGERRYDEVQGWEQEFKGDDEFGGSNAKETLTQARKALNQFGTVEEVKRLKAEFDRTGLGNHPVLIRGLARLARYLDD